MAERGLNLVSKVPICFENLFFLQKITYFRFIRKPEVVIFHRKNENFNIYVVLINKISFHEMGCTVEKLIHHFI